MKNSVVYHPQLLTDRLAWSDFVGMINYAYDKVNPSGSNYSSKEIVGSVNFWQRLTLSIDLFSPTMLARLDKTIEHLKKVQKGYYQGAFAVVSFTNHEPTTGKHADPVDIAYWQCMGKAEWTVFVDSDVTATYLLSPGDVICVSAGTLHEVKSCTPRAAMSFMFK